MDEWDINITPETIENYTKKHGSQSCARIMSVLGKKQPFYEAIRTDIGQELLKDVIQKMEILLEKAIVDDPTNPMTDADKAEYRVLKNLAETWANRIHSYRGKIQKLKEG